MLENENKGFISAVKEFFTELLFGGEELQYENFSFGSQLVTYKIVIIGIALGIIIAAGVMIYKRRVLGKVVRALSEANACSPEEAKSLSELDIKTNFFIASSLKSGTLMRMLPSLLRDEYNARLIESFSAEKKKGNKIHSFKGAPERDKYYLPKDEAKRSSLISLFSEKGNSAVTFALTVIFCIVAVVVLFEAVPWFLGLLDSSL